MNKQQRKVLASIISQLDTLKYSIEEIQLEEQEKYDNIPENLQGCERGERLESNSDNLQSAVSSIEEAVDYIQETIE
jgi:hypothetical protein